MAVELDHVFIRASAGAPEADLLINFGLTEGRPNHHPGQGTACRRFFFRNAMLELLWVEDAVAAATPLQITARRSPFGVCVRPANPLEAAVPFAAWEYRPSYLPEPLAIHMASGSPLEEPLWFYLGFGQRPDRATEHACGFREVTGVRLTSPVVAPSEAMAAMVREQVVTVDRGSEHLLELTFDGGGQKRSSYFRPSLPLVFRW